MFSRLSTIKEFVTSFSSLTLHAIDLLLWKKILSFTLSKIVTVSRQSILLRFFFLERLGCSTNWTLSFFCISPPPKNWFPLSVSDHKPYVGKKVFLIALRQILLKIFPAAYISSYTTMTNLRKVIGTEHLNTKQCPAGLSFRIIPHYCPKRLQETLRMEENPS